MTHIQEFIDAIREYGANPADESEFIDDNQIRRAHDVQDKPRKTSISYQLMVDADGFACGWFVAYKVSSDTQTWHSAPPKGQVRDYKAREKAWRDSAEQRDKREADRKERNEQAVREIADMLSKSDPADGHEYLVRKGVSWPALRQHEGVLLVPVSSPDGGYMGCQRIQKSGFKSFVTGSEKRGGFYLIADRDDDFSRIFITEGLSTGMSVRDAAGSPVYVAFDAGNLKPVARMVAAKYPRAVVVIAADNDAWTKDAKGQPYNAGIKEAEQAAVGIGAVVWAPEGLEYPNTDWNDAVASMGRDWVVAQLDRIPQPVPEPEYEPVYESVPVADMSPSDRVMELINPLGYEGGTYYFLPRDQGQVVELAAPSLSSPANLFQMATPEQYMSITGNYDMKHSDIANAFMPILINLCHAQGVYEPSRVYGAGAWRLGSKVYVNKGNEVYRAEHGDVVPHSSLKINGVMVKEAKSYSLDGEALRNADAHKLVQICTALTWSRPISGMLLAGWLVLAPIGGALRWRPHVFITGQKGAGKSTVMEKIVEPILGDTGIRMDGGSTEAGLRKLVKGSSRPVIMDEFEAENKKDAESVSKILTWTRKASSGGMIVNANAQYRAQSCVCFAAINPMITQGADADRITLLELAVNKSLNSEAQYDTLLEMIHETITPEYSDALIKRSVDNIDTLITNCEMFSKHASRILKSKRAGDQIGPMLAGAYLLHSTKVATDEEAEAWCMKQDWSWIEEQNDGSDSERLMRRVLNSLIEYTSHDRTGKMPVSELISRVYHDAVDAKDCQAALGRVGMAVKDGMLCVANQDEQLSRLLEGTAWTAYKNSMLRYPGAQPAGKTMRFGAGSPVRYLCVPLDGMLWDSPTVTEPEVEEIETW